MFSQSIDENKIIMNDFNLLRDEKKEILQIEFQLCCSAWASIKIQYL